MKVCIGGTFNFLHKGHKTLIRTAFKSAGENGSVFIGITKGNILNNKNNVFSFNFRKKAIIQFLSEEGITKNFTIKPIFDKYGPSIDENFDAIIVSSETIDTAKDINKKRIKLQKKPLKIITIPFVMAKDNTPISSTRIRNKEIDEEGNILRKD